jgi:hypothetical protein
MTNLLRHIFFEIQIAWHNWRAYRNDLAATKDYELKLYAIAEYRQKRRWYHYCKSQELQKKRLV